MGTLKKTERSTGQASRCPICERSLGDADDPRAPFCSSRCQRIDLGKWLGGDYRVPSDESVDPWAAVPTGGDDDGCS